MAEVDPEKILAELEAARVAAKHAGRSAPGRNAVLLLVALLILAIGATALWVLAAMLEGMPRPEGGKPKKTSAFYENSPLPYQIELPNIPTRAVWA